MSIPLEALLRRMSRMAEQHFARHGDIDPMWLIETASGEQQLIITPFIAPNPLAGAEVKDRIAEKMRETFCELDVVRYARAVEAWTVPHADSKMNESEVALRYAALNYSLANHPDRREIVQISAEDGTELLWAEREIIRPQHGKPYLSKLSAIERPAGVRGRFLGLLPSTAQAQAAKEASPTQGLPRLRSSSELPDDVGRVFVTNVPGAPLQVTGRRDPETGELCVSGTIHLRPGAPDPTTAPDFPSFVEIVTGPEAERLILAVHRGMTERANEQNITLEEFVRREAERHSGGEP
jgi:hypothetical protein